MNTCLNKRVGMVAYNYVMATPTEGQPQTSTLSSSTVQWPDISNSEKACCHAYGHEHAYNSDVHVECEEESEKLTDPDRQ